MGKHFLSVFLHKDGPWGCAPKGTYYRAYLISINITGAKRYLLIWRNVTLASPGSVPLVHLCVVFIKTAALGKSICCEKHACGGGGGGGAHRHSERALGEMQEAI